MGERASAAAARAYLGWDRQFRRALLGVQAVADGFFLGVFDDRTLDVLDEEYYRRTRYYRADSYNERGLFDWEQRAIDDHFPASGHLVVVATGGGREVIALARQGFTVTGYESNDALATFAQDLLARTGTPAEVRLMARDHWPVDADPVDAAIVGWGAFHSIRGRDRRVAFLREARAALPEGAPILLSFFARQSRTTHLRIIARVGNVFRTLRRAAPIESGDTLTPVFAHHFTEQEIAGELAAAGFRLVTYHDDGYGRAVGVADTVRWIA